jgi:hypothetical protein
MQKLSKTPYNFKYNYFCPKCFSSQAIIKGTLYTHFDFAPKLSMNGAIPLLPPHAFMAWTWTTLRATCRPNLPNPLLFLVVRIVPFWI